MSKVEPHFDAILALVADGMSIEQALKSRPEFPIKATFKCFAYHADHPDRRKRLEEAQSVWSHNARSERHFDDILQLVRAGKTIGEALASDERFPCRVKFRLYVKARPELDRQLDEAKPNRSKMVPYFDEVRRRVDSGQSISCALDALPIQPSRTMFDGFVRKSDERKNWLLGLKRMRRSISPAARSAPLLRLDKREKQVDRALFSNELYRRVAAAVPRIIEASIREDVITDIIVAILSGKIREDEIGAEVKRRSRGYFREDRFKHWSIYTKTFGDSETTLLDTHSPDIQHWGL